MSDDVTTLTRREGVNEVRGREHAKLALLDVVGAQDEDVVNPVLGEKREQALERGVGLGENELDVPSSSRTGGVALGLERDAIVGATRNRAPSASSSR